MHAHSSTVVQKRTSLVSLTANKHEIMDASKVEWRQIFCEIDDTYFSAFEKNSERFLNSIGFPLMREMLRKFVNNFLHRHFF